MDIAHELENRLSKSPIFRTLDFEVGTLDEGYSEFNRAYDSIFCWRLRRSPIRAWKVPDVRRNEIFALQANRLLT